jgi:hypothetical protein
VLPADTIGYPVAGIASYLTGTRFAAHGW